jgi:AraC family transcriptional regulator of adaptative response / DNA-3-methyladenine glycosylase II
MRTYYQATPLDVLTDARITKACEVLLGSERSVAVVGGDVGYAGTSVFYDNFARLTGMTPAGYRGLIDGAEFEMAFPNPYPHKRLLDYLGRDPNDPTIQRNGDSFRMAGFEFDVCHKGLLVRVDTRGQAPKVHAELRRLIGLNQDARPLDTLLAADPRFAALAGEAGLRVFQTPHVFDAIVWSILGQQLTVRFAMLLRRRLFEHLRLPNGEGIYTPFQPVDVAGLDPEALLPLQFSLRKGEYLVGVARRFLDEGLDPERMLNWPATRVQCWLSETRGFGPWSTNYVMMRGFGFANCVPFGDTGLTSGLAKLYGLERRPTPEETTKLMKPFEPYRSLATFRIWFAQRYFDADAVVA